MDIDKILQMRTEDLEALTEEQRLALAREHLPVTQPTGSSTSSQAMNTKEFLANSPKKKRAPAQAVDPQAMLRLIEQTRKIAGDQPPTP